MKKIHLRISEVPLGSALLMGNVAVLSVEGGFCATQARCTRRQRPLSESTFGGLTVTCPPHGSRFNARTVAVLRGPAKDPLNLPRDGGRRRWARRRSARTCCPKRVTCE